MQDCLVTDIHPLDAKHLDTFGLTDVADYVPHRQVRQPAVLVKVQALYANVVAKGCLDYLNR